MRIDASNSEEVHLIFERAVTPRASQRNFIAISTLLFVASAALTIAWCSSMSAMHAMPMPGGWTMSMMWMRMPGQTWPGSAVEFLGMWLVMMVAMMLPSLLPMVWRYRQAVPDPRAAYRGLLTSLVGTGYYVAWTLFGGVAFLVGATVASLEMQLPQLARATPTAKGGIVLIAGLLQFSAWKSRHLACCRGTGQCCVPSSADARTAWRYGLRLGMHCVHCCFGLTVVLLVIGVMDLRAMAVVTVMISVERLAPRGEHVARIVGVVGIAAGLFLLASAVIAQGAS